MIRNSIIRRISLFLLVIGLFGGCSVYNDNPLYYSAENGQGGNRDANVRTTGDANSYAQGDSGFDGSIAGGGRSMDTQGLSAGGGRGGSDEDSGSPMAGVEEAGGKSGNGVSTGGSGESGAAGGATPVACPKDSGGVNWSVNGHCYFVTANSTTWNVNRDTCSNARACLATITSDAEQDFVSSLVGTIPVWIGLQRSGDPNFSWISGEKVSYTNWEPGEPNSNSGDVGVVIQNGTFTWLDYSRYESFPGMCELQ